MEYSKAKLKSNGDRASLQFIHGFKHFFMCFHKLHTAEINNSSDSMESTVNLKSQFTAE